MRNINLNANCLNFARINLIHTLKKILIVVGTRPNFIKVTRFRQVAQHFPELEVLELIGVGGMGAVYKARQISLDRDVAIKILPAQLAEEAEFRERFTREAQVVAQLDHPNIVRLRGFFNANGTAYLVMDFYEGMSLDSYFVQVKPLIEPVVASALMQMVLDGLDYVHHHGVVHRDLKPHNIYLAAVGKAIT